MTNKEALIFIKSKRVLDADFVEDRKAIGIAIEALEKLDKDRWHDLRKDRDDLPMNNEEVFCITRYDDYAILHISHGSIYFKDKPFWVDRFNRRTDDIEFVKAWKYIEPFEGGER